MMSRCPDILRGLALLEATTIEHIAIGPLEGRLDHPFVIASDVSKQECVDNVIVTLRLEGGSTGYGEAAPFKGISGDSQRLLNRDIRRFIPHILGWKMPPCDFAGVLRSRVEFPAARAALEMAYLDAYSRRFEKSLYKFLYPKADLLNLRTDITIPIVGAQAAFDLASNYSVGGFDRIKVKVGDDVEEAYERVEAVIDAYDEKNLRDRLELLVDANEGYSAEDAILFVWLLSHRLDKAPAIFEQPVKRDDMEGMKHVRLAVEEYGTRVFADESVFSVSDALKVIDAGAADGINLKLMKHGGIVESLMIAELAQARGLELMIGGMVETKLAMSASLHMAQLVDPVWIDLDTPLLMKGTGLAGGMIYDGASVMLPETPGIGVEPLSKI